MADGDLVYIPDETGGRLGRNIVAHDPSNRNFPVRGILFGDQAPIVTKTWWRRGIFDQDRESSCTAQAAAGVLHTSPNRIKLVRTNLAAFDDPAERFSLYRAAQQVDPWPGDAYDGSSTDAPFRVLRDRGHISEWRWCFGLADVLRTLSHHGPVAVGTNWLAGMETPSRSGFVKAEGDALGGHAYELIGLNVERKFVTACNSWGDTWGMRGRFRISFDHLEQLLKDQGEACTVVL